MRYLGLIASAVFWIVLTRLTIASLPERLDANLVEFVGMLAGVVILVPHGFLLLIWHLTDIEKGKRAAQEKMYAERFSGLTYIWDFDNLPLSRELAAKHNPSKQGKSTWPKTQKFHARHTPSTRKLHSSIATNTTTGRQP